jgi:CHASE2 domain-containing sensor protein
MVDSGSRDAEDTSGFGLAHALFDGMDDAIAQGFLSLWAKVASILQLHHVLLLSLLLHVNYFPLGVVGIWLVVTLTAIFFSCLLFLISGGWLPLIPAVFSVFLTAGCVVVYHSYKVGHRR